MPFDKWEMILKYRLKNKILKECDSITQLINLGLKYRVELFNKAMKETFEEDDELLKSLATK